MLSAAFKSFSSNITTNYDVGKTPITSSGAWTIFDGKKKSTGASVSIFVFERKALDLNTSAFGARASATSIRKVQEEVVERLKKEANSLARLRHPSILQLVEPVEDTRNGGLMFATEQVTASLAGLLAEKDQQEGAGNAAGRKGRYMVEDKDGRAKRRDIEMDELEIQKGLLQVSKGLEFLHESAGLVHGNMTPEAIYVNSKSDWKISGMSFAGPPAGAEGHQTIPTISLSEALYYDHRLPQSVQLNLDYSSSDFVLDNNVNVSADIFSLGLVIIAIYNSPHISPVQTNGNQGTYKKIFSSESTTPSARNEFLSSRPLPKELKQNLPRILARRPAQRLTAREFQQSSYFDNILVNTIRFLDEFPAKTSSEKAQFMRGLGRVMPQFPASVLGRKVLLVLLEEMKDKELLSLILQNVFKIVETIPAGRRVFSEQVLPAFRGVFLAKAATQERDSGREAGLMVIVEKMDLIVDSCSGKEFKDDVLPILSLAMESPTHSLVDASLKRIAIILPVLDFSTIKHELFPCVATVFSKTSSLGIKISGLEALGTLCGGSLHQTELPADDLSGILHEEMRRPKVSSITALDKYTVQEKVVPLVKAIRTKEPGVMMAALNLLRQVGKVVDTDFLALDVLPILWAFSLGPLLNLQQFKGFMDLIKSLSSKIEREQAKKLQELSAANMDSQSNHPLSSPSANGLNSPDLSSANEEDFTRLVLGKPRAPSSQMHASDLPSFSWSSTKLQTNPASRAITPDNALSVFRPLQPSNSSVATGMESNLNPWNVPNTAPSVSTQQSTTFPSMQPLNPQTVHPSRHQQQQAMTFSIPPPPMASPTTITNAFANTESSLPRPVTGNNHISPVLGLPQYGTGLTGTLQNQSQPSNQTKQKAGLDKYQSLL